MNVTITLSAGSRHALMKLDNFQKVALPEMADAVSRGTATRIVNKARSIVNEESLWHGKKPGQLEKSIFINNSKSFVSKNNKKFYVEATAPYAAVVERGAKPHAIRMPVGSAGDKMATGWRGNSPKRKYGGYRTHFHPGFEGMFFMSGAFNHGVNEMERLMKLENEKALSGLR